MCVCIYVCLYIYIYIYSPASFQIYLMVVSQLLCPCVLFSAFVFSSYFMQGFFCSFPTAQGRCLKSSQEMDGHGSCPCSCFIWPRTVAYVSMSLGWITGEISGFCEANVCAMIHQIHVWSFKKRWTNEHNYVGVSKNRGVSPQIINSNRVFP